MPRLPQPTAEGRQGILSLPQPSAKQFGLEASGQLTEFGKTLQEIGDKVQAQQDETDLIAKSNDLKVFLATLPDTIINDPNIKPKDRVAHYKAQADEFREAQLNEDANASVQLALHNHSNAMVAQGIVHMQAADVEDRVATSRATLQGQQDQFAEQQALALANGDGPGYATASASASDFLKRAETRRIINPMERQAAEKARTNRMFELTTEQNPTLMVKMTDDVKAGKPNDYGMDPQRATYYGNLAYNELHRRELLAQQLETRKAKELEQFAVSTKQDYYEKWTLVDEKGHRVYSTDQLLREAGKDRVLGNHKDETVSFLQSMLSHEQSSGGQAVDYGYYNKVILPSIYSGKYKTELDVLKAGGDKLGSHMGTAISAFQTYRSTVTTKITQDYDFGKNIITRTFAPLPGQQIDPLGVQQAGARAADRFNTWYTSLVERAKTEGPKAFEGIDIQAEARKIKDQEYQTLQDNIIQILDVTEATLQYKTVAEVQKAREKNEISIRQANLYLSQIEQYEYMKTVTAKKTAAPTAGGRIEKK